MVEVWWNATTYGHCLLVAPIIAWLVWQRRGEVGRLMPTGWWPGLAIVAIGGAGWLMGDAGSVAFARQFGVVMMLQGAVATIMGPVVARGLLFPLFYAFFLVPFGEGLEPPLQRVTVAIVMPLLDLVGIPATSNGVLIHAGRYYFEVAEACSGTKFVIAMLAFGLLVCNVCFTSWRRRAAFMAVALIVPILANGVRAFATIWVADLTSVEAATGFDHIVYGWVFFGLVMAGVLALGWRWFDRAADAPAFDPAAIDRRVPRTLGAAVAAVLVVSMAAAFPAWSAIIAGRATPLPARIRCQAPPGGIARRSTMRYHGRRITPARTIGSSGIIPTVATASISAWRSMPVSTSARRSSAMASAYCAPTTGGYGSPTSPTSRGVAS